MKRYKNTAYTDDGIALTEMVESEDGEFVRFEDAQKMLEALIAAHIALEYVSEYDIPLCTKERVVKAIENAAGMKIEEVLNCENKK